MTMHRRSFLAQSLTGTAMLATGRLVSAQPSSSLSGSAPTKEPRRGTPLDPLLVKTFVAAGHRDLPKIKELLAQQPRVLDASWDLGGGDWETALGAASHTGNRAIAVYLLERGARPDAFCAAMLGETEFVASLVRFSPSSANARGPHGYSLMYHIGYSGNIALAKTASPRVSARGRDFDEALHSATLSGHTELVGWLLRNGVENVNTRIFAKTPLDVAREKHHADIAELLRGHGGTTSR